MAGRQEPFNLDILKLTDQKLQAVRQVKVVDIYNGMSSSFHPDGLFSIETFGKVGDEARFRRFGFIDIRIDVFHPAIYRALISLKRIYADIIAGNKRAIWDNVAKDFVPTPSTIDGETGFHFFMSHWKDIKFEETGSTSREQNIKLLQKFKDAATTSKVAVMPAGYRDVEIDQNGRTQIDEINDFYKSLITTSNTIALASVANNPELSNRARYRLQMTFNNLYDHLEAMVDGKKKLIMGKWASRRIWNGTRNVITSMDTSTPYLGAKGAISFNNTEIGLYQMLKAILPVSVYNLRNGFLTKVFSTVNMPAILVDKKTLRSVQVNLKSEYFDRWMTNEGIENVINSFAEESLRNKPLEVAGHYIGLVYKGPDGTFKLIQDIDDVPEGRSKEDVHPLTFCELLYLSVYRDINRYPLFVTRYPITGIGSIYPSFAYVRTTIKAEARRELDDAWLPMDDHFIAHQFPIDGPYVNSLVPHSSKLARLGADFDGDTCSGNATYSEESVEEVTKFFGTKRAYVGPDGRFLSSVAVNTVVLVTHNLTGP